MISLQNLSKYAPVLFLSVLISNSSLSQSIDVYGGAPYYFMQLDKYDDYIDVTNDLNFTVGVSVNKYINTFKIEFGIAYGTKNYTFHHRNLNSLASEEKVQLSYYLIPIIIHKRLFTDSKNTVSLSLGSVFLKPFGYSKETLFKDGSKEDNRELPVSYKIGNTVRLGMKYSRNLIGPKFMIFSEIYGDYKFNMDYSERGSSVLLYDLTDDRFNLGLNIGVEWIFSKSQLNYYDTNK